MMKAVVVACSVLVASASAWAQTPAQAAFKQGQALYKNKEFDAAAEQFKLAYDHDADPVYLFNIAQAYRLAKKCKDAADYYRRYLDGAKQAPNVDAVNAYLVEVDACAKAQEPAAVAPPAEPAKPVEATAAPPPVVQPAVVERAPAVHSNKRLVGYIVAGGGVALAGLGVLFMTQVSGYEDDANAVCPQPCTSWDEDKLAQRAAIDDKASTREKLMVGSFIGGGAAIAAGVYLIVTGGETRERGVAIRPTRNGVMATFRF